jgi:hypothetical protein
MSATCIGMRLRPVRSALGLVLGLALAGLPGCGGGGDSNPVGPTPPQTVTTTLPTSTFVGIVPGEVRFTDVTVNVTGTLTATLDWTFASNDLDIYVTSSSCTVTTTNDIQNVCSAIGRTTSTSAKPERLTVSVTPGPVRVWAANFGPTSESGTLAITVTGTR